MESFRTPTGFEPTALFLWALSGAIVARRKAFDLTGVFVIALVSATGGGIIRDGLFLQQRPLVVSRGDYLLIIAAATAVVALFGAWIERIGWWERLVALIDAVGTPMYAFLGTALALQVGVHPAGALLIGTVNGVGGGILRDLLVGDVPQAFRPGQFYVILVVLACALYELLVLAAGWGQRQAGWLAIGLFVVARLLAIRCNWRSLPVRDLRLAEGLASLPPVERITRLIVRPEPPAEPAEDRQTH